jgi:hypothetical protein
MSTLRVDSIANTAGVTTNRVIQTSFDFNNTYTSTTAVIPIDNTVPLITEGTEILSATITPTSASNKLLIFVTSNHSHTSAGWNQFALFNGSTAINGVSVYNATSTGMLPASIIHQMNAGTTSSLTFSVRVGGNAGTVYINGSNSSVFGGSVLGSSLVIMEIAQ